MTIGTVNSIAPLPTLSPVQARQNASLTSTKTQASPPTTLTYASPVFQFNSLANIPIEVFRDPTTGATTRQIPSEQVVKQYELGLLKRPSVGNTPTAASPQSGSTASAATAAATGTGTTATTTTSAVASAATTAATGAASSLTSTSTVSLHA